MTDPNSAPNHAALAQQAADLLLPAWRDPAGALPRLPAALVPVDESQAYAVQQALMPALGAIGGWKVGASSPDADAAISCAPMPLANMHEGDARLPSTQFTYRAVEAEICFRMKHDLDADRAPFTRAQVIEAIASCHAGIEVLQSRFQDMDAQDRLSNLADMIGHGAYIVGATVPDWQAIDWDAEDVQLVVDGQDILQRTANPAGEMIRLVQWMANRGAIWAGGLKAGQIVTCGSWTGKTVVGATATAAIRFQNAGALTVKFG